jgi:hypothetical protein
MSARHNLGLQSDAGAIVATRMLAALRELLGPIHGTWTGADSIAA